MFEQAYYNAPAAQPVREGDFLYGYEVRGWQLGPRIYKILGAAVLANLLMLLVFAETPFMTARGCDGPFISRVCEVLDTVEVATALFGTPREYVDQAYNKTNLGDADITFVDVSNADAPLEYPAGYFQVANPEDQLPPADQTSLNNGYLAPGIPATNPTQNTPPLINTPQVLPTPNANAVDETNLPKSIDDTTGSPTVTVKKGRDGRIKKPSDTTTATTNNNTNTSTANPTPGPTLPPNVPTDPNAINSRPFKDLAAKVLGMQAAKTVDLQAPLQLSATAKIDKDGKIAKGSFKFIKVVSSDKELVDVAKDAVSAFNDSNLLTYLQPISGERIDFSLQQDDKNITAGIQSALERESKATAVVGLLKLGIQQVINKKQDEIKNLQTQLAATNDPAIAAQLQNEQDDLALLNATTIVANGKTLSITFTAPKDILHQMIQRKLDEQAAQMKKEGGATSGTPEN
ncbi:MAG TPA: hypothetical protein VGJ02_00245, partial [Pyrinomonadaceae bacterium]